MSCIVLSSILLASTCLAASWQQVDDLMKSSIAAKAFPGCTVSVISYEAAPRILYQKAYGNYTYDIGSPAVTLDTLFDLASVTKVISTTTAVAQLYQRGLLQLSDKPCSSRLLGAAFCAAPNEQKTNITVEQLMLHQAGFPSGPSVSFFSRSFACPETASASPRQVFTCQARIHAATLAQRLSYAPGSAFVYSDLSMMTMALVVGRLVRDHSLVSHSDLDHACVHGTTFAAGTSSSSSSSNLGESRAESLPVDQCYYEAYVRRHVIAPLAAHGVTDPLANMGFRPIAAQRARSAPTEIDSAYRHTLVQGYVHDENAYASGGIQGHAGLFSSTRALAAFMGGMMLAGPASVYPMNSTTVALFTRAPNTTFSSRAIGWDTASPPMVGSCGSLSEKSYMHLGFTGTLICADPTRRLVTVLLTNRVYPTRANTDGIRQARNGFNTLVQKIVDSSAASSAVQR